MIENVELRMLGPEDAAGFWQLRLRGFAEEPESFGSSYEEASRRPAADVARELGNEGLSPDDFVLGAFMPQLAGIVGLRRERRLKRSHRAEVWGMYVAREHRGLGIGAELLAALTARARQLKGLEQLLLTVMSENRAAIAVYSRAGFIRYGQAPKAMKLGERYFDEDLMRLAL